MGTMVRSTLTDDDGSGTTGSIWNNAELQKIYDNADAEVKSATNPAVTTKATIDLVASVIIAAGVLGKPELKNFVETMTAPAIVTTTKTIDQNTLANPSVVRTTVAHGFATNDVVKITGSNSTPSINGVWTITVIDATHFSVPVNVTVAGTAGTVQKSLLTLDLSTGCEFDVALTSDITQFAITNVPSTTKVTTLTIRFTADGTLRTITWPSVFKWPGGTAPTMTSTNGKVDILTARTYDGGVTAWYPAVYGQNC